MSVKGIFQQLSRPARCEITEANDMVTRMTVLTNLWAWYPPVGVFIAILAVVSVVVPFFRDLAKIGRLEKAVWTLVMLLLMLLEVKSIYQERDTHDTEQREARAKELEQFRSIGKDIKTSLEKMEKIVDLTGKAVYFSSNTLQQITGGGQFCYLVGFSAGPELIGLGAVNSGPLPLERCNVVVTNNVPAKPTPKSLQESLKTADRSLLSKEFGPLPPGVTIHPPKGFSLEMSGAVVVPRVDSYKIDIHTRDGHFIETLTLSPNEFIGDSGSETIKITDSTGKQVYLGTFNFAKKP